MSKYKEAKETLEKYDYSTKLELSEGIRNNITSGITVEQLFMMKETCIELLDKATPKKPLKSEWDGYRLCGNCNSIIVSTNQTLPNHCSSCGQKLDWGDVT